MQVYFSLCCFRPYPSRLAACRLSKYQLTKGRIATMGKQCHLLAKRWTILLYTKKKFVKKIRKRLRNYDIDERANYDDGISV